MVIIFFLVHIHSFQCTVQISKLNEKREKNNMRKFCASVIILNSFSEKTNTFKTRWNDLATHKWRRCSGDMEASSQVHRILNSPGDGLMISQPYCFPEGAWICQKTKGIPTFICNPENKHPDGDRWAVNPQCIPLGAAKRKTGLAQPAVVIFLTLIIFRYMLWNAVFLLPRPLKWATSVLSAWECFLILTPWLSMLRSV